MCVHYSWEYVRRTNRLEWVRVYLQRKCTKKVEQVSLSWESLFWDEVVMGYAKYFDTTGTVRNRKFKICLSDHRVARQTSSYLSNLSKRAKVVITSDIVVHIRHAVDKSSVDFTYAVAVYFKNFEFHVPRLKCTFIKEISGNIHTKSYKPRHK